MKDFQKDILLFAAVFLLAVAGVVVGSSKSKDSASGLWSIDNSSCVGCGGCATNCVRPESAVSAIMNESVCPQRLDCPAFFRKSAVLEDSPENELCPAGAINREHVTDSLFRYTIDQNKCIGCGKCSKICQKKCESAITLVIDKDECVDCNECQIAITCPKDAVSREGGGK